MVVDDFWSRLKGQDVFPMKTLSRYLGSEMENVRVFTLLISTIKLPSLEFGSENWKNCTPPLAESIEAVATNEPFLVLIKRKFDEEGPFNNLTLTNASEAASTASGKTDTTTGTGGACTARPKSADRDCETSEFQMETFNDVGPVYAGKGIATSVEEREKKKT